VRGVVFQGGKGLRRSLRAFLLLLLLCALSPSQAKDVVPTGPKVLLGILPVLDISGEPYGEFFAQNLTYMIFEQLRGSDRIEPRLLNPGGLYSTYSDDWIQDYGQQAGVDALLISVFPRSSRPKSSDATLQLETQVMELKSGRGSEGMTNNRSGKATYSTSIEKRELEASIAGLSSTSSGGYLAAIFGVGSWVPAVKKFEKTPLGKAARHLAEGASSQAVAEAPSLVPEGSALPHPVSKETCTIQFKVLYTHKKAASKAYDLAINDREESSGLQDGVASVQLTTGPVVARVVVRDAPYKTPIQRSYYTNTHLDCARPERVLALEIGAAGEALLHWQ
jgi:hypothetical protein